MPTQGFNLQTYADHFKFLLEGEYSSGSSLSFTDGLFLNLINESQRFFQDRLHIKRAVDQTLSVVAGQATYQIPSDILGRRIDDLRLDDVALTQVAFNPMWRTNTTTTGTPTKWAIDSSAVRTLRLWPVPSATGTLTIYYTCGPRPLSRIWRPSVVTAAVVNGSKTVTASDVLGSVLAGDEFGVRPTANFDGDVVSDESPWLWYRIASVDTAAHTLMLDENFGETSATTAQFVTAEVGDLEAHRPGKLGYSMVEFAVSLALRKESADESDRLATLALTALSSYSEDDLREVLGPELPGVLYPGFFG